MGKYHIAGTSGKAICGSSNARRQAVALPRKAFNEIKDENKCAHCVEKLKAIRAEVIKRKNEETQAGNEACRSATAQDIYGGDRP